MRWTSGEVGSYFELHFPNLELLRNLTHDNLITKTSLSSKQQQWQTQNHQYRIYQPTSPPTSSQPSHLHSTTSQISSQNTKKHKYSKRYRQVSQPPTTQILTNPSLLHRYQHSDGHTSQNVVFRPFPPLSQQIIH